MFKHYRHETLYLKGSTMVKDMIDDPIFLARKSEVATKNVQNNHKYNQE